VVLIRVREPRVRDTVLGYGVAMAKVTAEVVRLYRSVWKSLLLFAGGLFFAMVGALIILSRGIFGWVVGGFIFGFFGLAAGYMAVETPPADGDDGP
jgi:hypothetical protein